MDTNAKQLNCTGTAAGLPGVPPLYTHTPVRMLSLDDVQDCERLRAADCRQVRPDADLMLRLWLAAAQS